MYISYFGRTVFGRHGGALAGIPPRTLLTRLLKASPVADLVPDFLCVGMTRNAGNGPFFARQISHDMGWDVECNSITQACSTGVYAVLEGVRHGGLAVCATTESMSRAPKILIDSKLEEVNVVDGFLCQISGLTTVEQVVEYVSRHPSPDRATMDRYCYDMHRRGLAAWQNGIYRDVQTLDGLDRDEQLRDKPFESWGRARTIGNSEVAVSNVCGLSDGAGYVVVSRERGSLPVVARVVDWAFGFDDPRRTALASLDATRALFAKTGVALGDVDVFEIHDAFSLLGLKWLEATGADIDKVNLFGGSISLGHPIAATGMRLVQNAILGLERTDGTLAMLSVPSMGGYGMAMLIERCA